MSGKSSNNLVNPNARDAMNRFKMEAASQAGVTYAAEMGLKLQKKDISSFVSIRPFALPRPMLAP